MKGYNVNTALYYLALYSVTNDHIVMEIFCSNLSLSLSCFLSLYIYPSKNPTTL